MINLTPRMLQEYVYYYNYEVTVEQAKKILDLLDDYYGTFTSADIERVTDYIVNGNESIFAYEFN